MKDFSVLKLLDKLAHLFNKLHVDYPTMRRILQVKLLMDERRVPTILSNSQKPEGKNSFKSSLFLYGFIGLFIGLLMLLPLPLFVTMNIVFGTIMFMVMATMISDFSTVLLDVKDKNILLPRPVDSKSVNTAKIIHIVIYLITITLSISGPALLIGSIKHGIVFTLIFLIELILICFLVVFITSILYLAILSMFDGEKLKDIINYFQILLSAFMLISYQFIGRIFDLSRVTITYDPAWWHFFIPTTWFAAPFTLFIEHNFTGFFTWSSLLGIIIPGLTTLLYVFLVMPYFESKLQKLNSSSGHIRQTNIKEKLQQAAARLLCFSPTESAFYRFTQNMLANERKLKLRMYPHLAFAIIMPFIIMASSIKKRRIFQRHYQPHRKRQLLFRPLHDRGFPGYYSDDAERQRRVPGRLDLPGSAYRKSGARLKRCSESPAEQDYPPGLPVYRLDTYSHLRSQDYPRYHPDIHQYADPDNAQF